RYIFFFSSRRRHTRSKRDWSSDVCSSDLEAGRIREEHALAVERETAWLSPEHRREVDVMLVDLFDTYGPRKLAGEARAHAQRLRSEERRVGEEGRTTMVPYS